MEVNEWYYAFGLMHKLISTLEFAGFSRAKFQTNVIIELYHVESITISRAISGCKLRLLHNKSEKFNRNSSIKIYADFQQRPANKSQGVTIK